MRRTSVLLVVALGLWTTAGCSIVNHGGELPTAAQQADADYYDPWHGVAAPQLPTDRHVR